MDVAAWNDVLRSVWTSLYLTQCNAEEFAIWCGTARDENGFARSEVRAKEACILIVLRWVDSLCIVRFFVVDLGAQEEENVKRWCSAFLLSEDAEKRCVSGNMYADLDLELASAALGINIVIFHREIHTLDEIYWVSPFYRSAHTAYLRRYQKGLDGYRFVPVLAKEPVISFPLAWRFDVACRKNLSRLVRFPPVYQKPLSFSHVFRPHLLLGLLAACVQNSNFRASFYILNTVFQQQKEDVANRLGHFILCSHVFPVIMHSYLLDRMCVCVCVCFQSERYAVRPPFFENIVKRDLSLILGVSFFVFFCLFLTNLSEIFSVNFSLSMLLYTIS